ncbi:MAG TPA: branched-chain amino acid ABC transporter ATP-binding protein/permease [Candidatus Limnocylindrales bacterium]|nr:branched-chain amino acid ABC transporter ATP-binding protein/permease [Candidatus Limnocylindrales bacterium]
MIRRGLLGFGLAYLALAALPFLRDAFGFPVFYLVFLSTIWFWTAQATSWNILSGYSGYFSFGQAALVGVGAYTTAVLVGRQDWPFLATLPLGGLLAALLALGIGALAFRLRSLRGEIFALLTLAVPFILGSLARILPAIDGGQGITVPAPDAPDPIGGFQELLYLLSLTVAMGALATAFLVQHSRTGWALFAIHDAEDVAEGLGIPTFRAKMVAIGLSGLIGGLAGSLFALQIGFVTVESVFGLTIPLFVIVMCVLGGRTSWLGPLLGAVIIVTLQDRLASAGFQGWSLVILGSILAALVVLAPDGLVARLRARAAPVAAAFVVPFVALAIVGFGDGLVDWLAGALIAAAIVAFVPVPASLARSVRARVGRPTDRGTAAEPATQRPPLTTEPLPAPPDAGSSGPVLECADVVKRYGGLRALDGVSLRIDAGELVGLVGPNGSGKTTLIGILSGALRPTSGSVQVAGRPTAALSAHEVAHLGIARTYQIPRPFGSMTVRDNVAMAVMFGRRAMSIEAARDRADRHLEVVGLAGRASHRPSGINLHERQLLEMARALATEPRILLLDEALAGLNPAEIDQAVEVVRRIHASGVTIVIVEHLLRVVNQLATRIVVLDQGRLLAAGEPAAVMRDPAVVRAYLGRLADA